MRLWFLINGPMFMNTMFYLHAYKLNLNDSPFCILHAEESIYDQSHIIFDYPPLSAKRTHLINSFNSLNFPFTLSAIFHPNTV